MKVEIKEVERTVVEKGAVIELSGKEAGLLAELCGSLSFAHITSFVGEDKASEIDELNGAIYDKLKGFRR